MRKERTGLLILFSLFILLFGTTAWAQSSSPHTVSTRPDNTTTQVQKIPRRVQFRYTADLNGATTKTVERPFDKSITDILYSNVASIQPIVEVDDPEKAHNICTIEVSSLSGDKSNTPKLIISITLGETQKDDSNGGGRTEKIVSTSAHEFDGDMVAYTNFIEQTAKEMAPHLELVKPEVRLSSRVKGKEGKELVRELTFAEQLARPLSLRARIGNLTLDLTDFGDIETRLAVLPFFIDASRYFGKNHGIVLSLMADMRDADDTEGLETFLLPGIGYSYRSLRKIAAGFDLVFYGGRVFGKSTTDTLTLLSISPSVTWNISPSAGISVKPASLYFSFDSFLLGSYTLRRNLMFQQILALGFVYRPDW